MSEQKNRSAIKVRGENFSVQKSLKINKIEVQTSRRGGKVFVLNSIRSMFGAKS